MKVLNETQQVSAETSFNARFAASAIFKTVSLLEGRYAADYLDRILRGESRFGFRVESHKQLETFGLLERFWRTRVIALMDVLVEDGFLIIKDANYGNLDLGEGGKAFLENPHDIFVDTKRLRITPKDGIVYSQLRQLRKEIAEQSGLMPYEVFTNFALKGLVKQKPEDIASLKSVPGMQHVQADRYGQAITDTIKDVNENAWKLITVRKAHYPSSQEIKSLLESGKSLPEIATAKSWNEDSVIRTIESLHLSGEFDATEWIEKQVDAKVLNKGIKYFQQVENQLLKAAYETLELDYRTLRMCRLYISEVIQIEDELKLAA
ncbi:MAG: HRDC domain-containing protein [Bacteroidia bacterium]